MQGVIKKEINYLTEAFALLNLIAAEEGIGTLKQSLSKKYDLKTPELSVVFALLEKIEKDAGKTFKKQMNRISYYFGHEEQEVCLAEVILMWQEYSVTGGLTIQKIEEGLSAKNESDYCKKFCQYLRRWSSRTFFEGDQEEATDKESTTQDVMQQLLKMDLPAAKKVAVQEVFWNREQNRNEVLKLLAQAEDFLHHYEEGLQKEAQKFYDYWSEQDFISKLEEHMEITVDERERGYEVWPLVIDANQVSIMCNPEEKTKPYMCCVGLLFSSGMPFGNKPMEEEILHMEEYVSQVLKLLADKSKFEILTYIKDKRAYGSELAKHLGLTTATISHHMSALINCGLVGMEKKENKIYYHGKKTEIERVLKYCRTVLIGE